MKRYKLKLKRLDFISAVDTPAQETATAVMLKDRDGAAEITARARVVKTSDELGLVFGWALTTKANGADYFDLHGDNIVEEDLIKVAAEFMQGGGATDQQHDFSTDGKVVFAMPLTAEVAKSFGIQTDTTGLMVAIKPSADVFAKFKSGEYTGFSIAGIGEREAVKGARVQKASLYTNEVDGHQHKVTVYSDGSLFVEWATMEGADQGHSHGIVFEGGQLTILADSGHTHELAEGQPGIAVVPADAIVVIQASANKSTQTGPANQTGPNTEKSKMANENEQSLQAKVDELTKKLEHQSKLATFSDAQREYYKTLGAEDREAFFAKSYTEREADVAPVYTSKSDGRVYRKSDPPALVEMARKMDRMLEELEKRDDALSRNEIAAIAKTTLNSVGGDDDVHKYIVKSIKNGGGDAGLIEQALATLSSANELAKRANVAKGFNPGKEPGADSPEWQAEALAQRYAAEHKVDIVKARGLIWDTPEGSALYSAIEKRKQAARG